MTTKFYSAFGGLFRRLSSRRKPSSVTRRWKRQALLLEPLESRALLSGDSLGLQSGLVATGDSAVSAYSSTASPAVAEGEAQQAQQDLVAFAKALKTAGLQEYGAAWCTHCAEQREMFKDGQYYLPLNEVTNPDRTLNALGTAKNIASFPTWDIPDPGHTRFNAFQLTAGALPATSYSFPDANTTRIVGAHSLAVLSQISGVAIPTSNAPFLGSVSDTNLIGGTTLIVPVQGYDPNGDTLTYTVTSSNTAVTATIPQTNPTATIEIKDWGHITVELFQDKASRPVNRFVELANTGFYDYKTDSGGNVTNKVMFHRVIADFMIQAGDPTGTGSGGSTLDNFDDQFNVDLVHNSEGILSFAKSGDDTNDSQFFITLAATPWLDFNHSVFGKVTEGYDVLEAIGETKTGTSDKPTNDVIINKVTISNTRKNAVVLLKAATGATGQSDITVTANDGQGNTTQRTFKATLVADTTANGGGNNGTPFLADINPASLNVIRNTTAQLQLQGIDKEGNSIYYDATKVGTVNYTLDVNHSTGMVTVTPPAGYVGPMQVKLKAGKDAAAVAATSDGSYDVQTVTFNVLPETPNLSLLAASDTGTAGDNITSLKTPQIHLTNLVSGATVEILRGTSVVGQGVAAGGSLDVTANLSSLADGTYALTATQTLNGVKSAASTALSLTLDTTVPGVFTSTPPTKAFVDSALTYDAQHTDEGKAGFVYALVNAPSGAVINGATGVVTWTPTAAQVGSQSFQVKLTDPAGNGVTQNLSINVAQASVKLRLQPTNLSGQAITHVNIGDQFLLKVYGQDVRSNASSTGGVFAAYLNIAFDPTLVSSGAQTIDGITWIDPFVNGKAATFTSGAINEVGAFAGTTALGTVDKQMFTIPMTAVKAGTVNFTGTPATAVGHEVLLYGTNSAVSSDLLNFVTGTLIVDAGVVANNDTLNVDEDSTGNSLTVLTNDVNNQGGTLTITAVGATNHGGTVSIATDNQRLLYTPAANYIGEEQFTYTLSNGTTTSTATVTVQIQPKNDAPTATADTFTVATGSQSNALNVLANDSFAPDQGETLRVLSVGTTDKGGTVTIAPNGTNLIYTPASGFTGDETFTYTISDRADSTGLTSQATVKVTVTSLPTPTVVADTATVNENSTATTINVLSNDTPGKAGDALSVTAVTQPTNGTVTVGAQGANVSYTPKLYFSGTDTFTYTVQEANGGTRVGTVTVTVNALPAPTATADTTILVGGSSATVITVLPNDTPKTSGNALTVTAVGTPTGGGTVTIGTNGANVSYTPKAGFFGTDTFTYTVREQSAGFAVATVTVLVIPSATDDTFDVAKNATKTTLDVLKLATLNYASTNPYQQLTITAVTAGTAGATVAVSSDGKHVDYTPKTDYKGTDTLTYTVSDGAGHTAQGTVTVNVKEYVPRDISGSATLYSATTSNRMWVGGLDVVLSGTELSNAAVSKTIQTDISGNYAFADLGPGEYRVSRAAEPFLLTDSTTLTVKTTGLADSDSTGNNFTLAGRKAAFISILDFLVTAPRQSTLSPSDAFVTATTYVATTADDAAEAAAQKWVTVESGWTGMKNVYVHLTQNPEMVHVQAVKTDGTKLHAELSPTDARHVQWLGQEGDAKLLRIIGSATVLNMDDSAAASPAAEGEAAATSSFAAVAETFAPVTTGEGEALATNLSQPAEGEGEAVASATDAVAGNAMTTTLATSSAPAASYVTAGEVTADSAAAQSTTSSAVASNESTAKAVDAVLAGDDFASDSSADSQWTSSSTSSESPDYADAVDQVLAGNVLDTAV